MLDWCWVISTRTSWVWKVHRGKRDRRCGLSGKRRASKGTEFAKAAPARDPPPAEPADAAAASGSNGADAEQAPTPPPTADVEAGPAEAGPGESAAVPRPAAKAAGRRGRA